MPQTLESFSVMPQHPSPDEPAHSHGRFRDAAEVAVNTGDSAHGLAMAAAINGIYESQAARARRQLFEESKKSVPGDPTRLHPDGLDLHTKALILDAKRNSARQRSVLP